jgi:hypothetical protein
MHNDIVCPFSSCEFRHLFYHKKSPADSYATASLLVIAGIKKLACEACATCNIATLILGFVKISCLIQKLKVEHTDTRA